MCDMASPNPFGSCGVPPKSAGIGRRVLVTVKAFAMPLGTPASTIGGGIGGRGGMGMGIGPIAGQFLAIGPIGGPPIGIGPWGALAIAGTTPLGGGLPASPACWRRSRLAARS